MSEENKEYKGELLDNDNIKDFRNMAGNEIPEEYKDFRDEIETLIPPGAAASRPEPIMEH